MGRRNFHGPVLTLVDASEADYLVIIRCERCDTRKQTHAHKLISKYKKLTTASLGTPLPGFYCKTCRSSLRAIIVCTYEHPGG